MKTACLKGFLDCSHMTGSADFAKQHGADCQRRDTLLRSGLLIISFAVFSLLIGPQLQGSLPKESAISEVATVVQHKRDDVKLQPSRVRYDNDKTAKAMLILSLLGAGNKN